MILIIVQVMFLIFIPIILGMMIEFDTKLYKKFFIWVLNKYCQLTGKKHYMWEEK